MSTNLTILLFLLSFSGVFWIVHGDVVRENDSTVVQVPNNNPSLGERFTRIPKAVVQKAAQFMSRIFNTIVMYARPVIQGTMSLVIDGLGYLASSDNTEMVRTRRSVNDYQGQSQQSGRSLPSMLSRAFMFPFKIFFGSVRRLPVGSIYNRTETVFEPFFKIARHPVVRTLTNATTNAATEAADEAWHFATRNLFPRLDKLITQLQDSQTLPQGVQTYLNELQALYRVMHMVNMA